MTKSIAVINAGSSSIKFAIYEASDNERCLFQGQVEGIGVKPHLKVADAAGAGIEERSFDPHGFDHGAATREIIELARRLLVEGSVAGVGHRVVHGGLKYASPVRVTEAVLDDLAELTPLPYMSRTMSRPCARL